MHLLNYREENKFFLSFFPSISSFISRDISDIVYFCNILYKRNAVYFFLPIKMFMALRESSCAKSVIVWWAFIKPTLDLVILSRLLRRDNTCSLCESVIVKFARQWNARGGAPADTLESDCVIDDQARLREAFTSVGAFAESCVSRAKVQ